MSQRNAHPSNGASPAAEAAPPEPLKTPPMGAATAPAVACTPPPRAMAPRAGAWGRVGGIGAPPGDTPTAAAPHSAPPALGTHAAPDDDDEHTGAATLPVGAALDESDAAHVPPCSAAPLPALASLHLAALQLPSLRALAPELDLLALLLTLPPTATSSAPSLLCCGAHAARHAGTVLEGLLRCGVLRALPISLVSALLEVPVLRDVVPAVHASLLEAATRAAAEPTLGSGTSDAWAPWAGGGATHDGRAARSQDEQRRVSNREASRDAWLGLMREAEQLQHCLASGEAGTQCFTSKLVLLFITEGACGAEY